MKKKKQSSKCNLIYLRRAGSRLGLLRPPSNAVCPGTVSGYDHYLSLPARTWKLCGTYFSWGRVFTSALAWKKTEQNDAAGLAKHTQPTCGSLRGSAAPGRSAHALREQPGGMQHTLLGSPPGDGGTAPPGLLALPLMDTGILASTSHRFDQPQVNVTAPLALDSCVGNLCGHQRDPSGKHPGFASAETGQVFLTHTRNRRC